MDIFDIFTICGGLAFFLYGINVLSSGLEKMAGGKLESALKKVTSNPWKGLVFGAGITAAIQSSSAITVMLVGLVNSGIMSLSQTISVIMGSNIGTTVTAWILSLASIDAGGNFFLKLLNPESFSPLLALLGIIFIMTKSDKRKNVGKVLVGFAILMYGMTLMKGAVEPLAQSPEFAKVLVMFENPVFGVVVGAVVTAVVQSSAASIGMLQALSATGNITYMAAVPIIMGQNIGTCISALLSSIGVNKSAKRVSVVHVTFNVLGTLICLPIFILMTSVFDLAFAKMPIDAAGISLVHSVFNIVVTVILFPFSRLIEKLAYVFVKDDDKAETYSILDSRLAATPSVAVAECGRRVKEMAYIAKDAMLTSVNLITNYDPSLREVVLSNEDVLDNYEDSVGSTLVKLSSRSLSTADSRDVSVQLHAINDFERIGDHAVNIMGSAEEMVQKNIVFSAEAQEDLNRLTGAIGEILDLTVTAYEKEDVTVASQIEPIEQVIDELISRTKSRHIDRLKDGKCTMEMGFVLVDLLTDLERVSDHCSNVAATIIETAQGSFDRHKYLSELKNGTNPEYERQYQRFAEKYLA